MSQEAGAFQRRGDGERDGRGRGAHLVGAGLEGAGLVGGGLVRGARPQLAGDEGAQWVEEGEVLCELWQVGESFLQSVSLEIS